MIGPAAGNHLLLICFWFCAAAAVVIGSLLGLGHYDLALGIAMPEDFGYFAVVAAVLAGLVFRVSAVAAVGVAALAHGTALVAGHAASPEVGDTAAGSLIAIYVVALPLLLAGAAGLGALLGTAVVTLSARRG